MSPFNAIDYFVWALFVVDYLVRLYLVEDRKRFFTLKSPFRAGCPVLHGSHPDPSNTDFGTF
jgi:hypothetical protein